ncbi:PRTRC system protein E [Caballeronia sp. LjRoot31]|uniref:PRTRC system protein E n=1 Tax=Caballeronia sp. LjRoot31 TaxID=3342324 RepID=UPI003ECD01BC
MSLFSSLHPLAQKATLIVLITAEGDQLRVNVTPQSKDEKASKKTLYPLSILAAPDELDRDFAKAVSIYEPGALSVIDQAYRANAANRGSNASEAALPAPSKNKPGRKAKTAPVDDPAGKQEAPEENAEPDTLETDPRQTSIPGIDPLAAPPVEELTPAQATTESPAAPVTASADEALDLM